MSDEMRERVLLNFRDLPQEFLDEVWSGISTGTHGKLSPEVLRSADLMGKREPYLEKVLLDTRALEKLDVAWETVPLPERRELLDKAEQRWAAEETSAVAGKARRNWREMVEREWGMR